MCSERERGYQRCQKAFGSCCCLVFCSTPSIDLAYLFGNLSRWPRVRCLLFLVKHYDIWSSGVQNVVVMINNVTHPLVIATLKVTCSTPPIDSAFFSGTFRDSTSWEDFERALRESALWRSLLPPLSLSCFALPHCPPPCLPPSSCRVGVHRFAPQDSFTELDLRNAHRTGRIAPQNCSTESLHRFALPTYLRTHPSTSVFPLSLVFHSP